MILLDTHALIWWTLDPVHLSKKAARACSDIERKGGMISSITIWEIGIKIKNKKIDIGMNVDEYLTKLKSLNMIEIAAVDERIWIESILLPWKNRDPADRVIVATAKLNNVPIISKDDKIITFYKNTIW